MYQQVKFACAVPAVLVVFEIKPEPSVASPVTDVELPGLRIPRDHDKQKTRRGELNPSNRLGFVRCCDQSVDRLSYEGGRCHSDDWLSFHVTKHRLLPPSFPEFRVL